MTDEQPSLDGWDDFSGEFLKTDLIDEFPVTLVPIGINAEYDENAKPRMVIEVEYHNKTWKLELNKTNQNFIRSMSLAPKDIVGHKLVFDKVPTRNPRTGKPTESFLITKID